MSKILSIIKDPDPRLRKKSVELEKDNLKTEEFKTLCQDMMSTMQAKDGIGLAAPQIGQNIRLIAINIKDGAVCLINPKIKHASWSKEWDEEGCLSIPHTFGKVKRPKSITCTFLNLEGKKNKIRAKGLLARVIQHEIDHLDGILFIDKAKDIKRVREM